MVRRRSALRHAQVIGPRGPLFPDSQMTAMVAISPLYLPEGFAVVHVDDSVPVVLTWLVPITSGEADVISSAGWKALEQVFVAQDPDLSDPGRPEVALREPGS